MKVVLVYDRINKFGGAERVLWAFHKIWPEAPVFASVYDPEGAPWAKGWEIRTSWLQNLPGAKTNHESLGWLMPLAFESLDLSGYDVIISVTSEAAKGVITRPGQLHVCYLLTPTRYLWSHEREYRQELPWWLKGVGLAVQANLRKWDYIAAQRPDYIISISELVKKRCEKYYHRQSEVIYPPVTLRFESRRHFFDTLGQESSLTSSPPLGQQRNKVLSGSSSMISKMPPSTQLSYYLAVSRLVRYKRIDLAITACNRLKENLVIVGSGSDEPRLRSMAGPTVKFVGNLTDGELVGYYQGAKALIMPQEEDFGLTAVEALFCGTPVVSFRNSGAAEAIDDGRNGILFDEQTVESLVDALRRFKLSEVSQTPPAAKFAKQKFAKQTADKFSERVFREKFKQRIEDLWKKH